MCHSLLEETKEEEHEEYMNVNLDTSANIFACAAYS
jgi:hypothetical protein